MNKVVCCHKIDFPRDECFDGCVLIKKNKAIDEYERGFNLALIRRVNYSSDDVQAFLKRTFRTPYEKGFRDGLMGVRTDG